MYALPILLFVSIVCGEKVVQNIQTNSSVLPSRKPIIPILDTLIGQLINSQIVPPPPTLPLPLIRPTILLVNDSIVNKSVNSTVSSKFLSNRTLVTTPTPKVTINNTCLDGVTYWDARAGQCTNCTKQCPNGALIYKQCNLTSDLQCVCPKGAFMSVVDNTCKQCSKCSSGWGKIFLVNFFSHSHDKHLKLFYFLLFSIDKKQTKTKFLFSAFEARFVCQQIADPLLLPNVKWAYPEFVFFCLVCPSSHYITRQL